MTDTAATHVDLKAGSERRMINRVATYWEELRGERHFPTMTDIEPPRLDDIKSNCFVLDVSKSVEEPIVRFVGDALSEDGKVVRAGESLNTVPKRTLFGRVSDHFLECIANGAPVGIEAEFDTEDGDTVMYRGVLLPFSDDDTNVDFILGAINFKLRSDTEMDVPDGLTDDEVGLDEVELDDDSGTEMIADNDDEPLELVDEVVDDVVAGPETEAEPAVEDEAPMEAPDLPDIEAEEPPAAATPTARELLNALSRCQSLAHEASESLSRSREALYTALAEAYSFRFEAEEAPETYAEILADAGIETQERAPYTPIVKLVFGADYDKTRISEYASALAYGLRHNVPRNEFKIFLEMQEGGIKACVAAERAARRAEKGESWDSIAFARSVLRDQPALGHLYDLDVGDDESEFVLILGRREPDREGVDIVKVLHEKPSIVDGILRRAAIDVPNPGPAVSEADEGDESEGDDWSNPDDTGI
jgi:hypothetical protein